jgi:hypothetical protein
MRELDVDPKIVADQLGHSVDVNLNVYTKTAIGLRKKARILWNQLFRRLNGVCRSMDISGWL